MTLHTNGLCPRGAWPRTGCPGLQLPLAVATLEGCSEDICCSLAFSWAQDACLEHTGPWPCLEGAQVQRSYSWPFA